MMVGSQWGAGAATGIGVGATLAGRYVLESLVATGGMGALFRGHDVLLERTVAVKTLHPHLAGTPDAERFQHEAQTLASLTHPNLVTIYDLGVDGGLPYIVMEFVEGESLAARIKREAPMPPDAVSAIALQLCRGLAHAHAWGVVHRDIKPQNILIAPDNQVKIVDFGIARGPNAAEMTAPGWVLGTAHYLAPEVAAGQPATVQADLYSLGVVLYLMLTGRLPFEGADPLAVVMMHRTQPPPRPSVYRPGLPPALEAVVVRLLDKDPARRFPSAVAVAAALSGAPLAAVPTAAQEAATRPLPRTAPLPVAPAPRGNPAGVPPPRQRRGVRGWHWVLLLLVAVGAAFIMWSWLRPLTNSPVGALGPSGVQPPRTTPVSASTATTTPSRTTPTPLPTPATTAPANGAGGLLASLTQDVFAITQGGQGRGELDQLFQRTEDLAKRVTQGKMKDAAEKAAEVREKLGDLVRRGELARSTAERLDAQVRALLSALPLEGRWRGDEDNDD